jgi:hypothetical protein
MALSLYRDSERQPTEVFELHEAHEDFVLLRTANSHRIASGDFPAFSQNMVPEDAIAGVRSPQRERMMTLLLVVFFVSSLCLRLFAFVSQRLPPFTYIFVDTLLEMKNAIFCLVF